MFVYGNILESDQSKGWTQHQILSRKGTAVSLQIHGDCGAMFGGKLPGRQMNGWPQSLQ